MPENPPRPEDAATSRRLFLTGCLAAAAVGSAGIGHRAAGGPAAPVGDLVTIRPDVPDLMRVRIEIDVKGNVNVSENPLASKKRQRSFPIQSEALLDFEQRMLRPRGVDRSSDVVAVERYYHRASSNSTLNKTSSKQTLRESIRHSLVRRDTLPEVVYSPDSYFTHGELSLLRSPVSSVDVESWLPTEPVAVGDRYEIGLLSLCSELNLSSVDSGKVDCEVIEITNDHVRFQLKGELEGSIEGVNTRQQLLGKMTWDRQAGLCTWLALAIHETRDIGKAEPGFDVSATIRMVRRPMESPVALPPQAAEIDFSNPAPPNRLYVELQSRHALAGVMMDRRWRLIRDVPGSAVMRMIENDNSVAQCNLRPLVDLPEGKQLTLEAFEADVKRTLGDKLVQMVEADQRMSAQDLRVLRVVADGQTQGVPIRWIMMHFSDRQGRRLQATVTLAADQIERFAGNDVQLADSLRFLKPAEIHDGAPAEDAEPMASADKNGEVPSIAKRLDDNPTASASDQASGDIN